jgi:hypothetical protein
MPDPYTDEALIASFLTPTLDLIYAELLALRGFAEAGALPLAAVLTQEYLMRQDLDGGKGSGGSVYGVDFHIDLADPGCPPILSPIHAQPGWNDTGVALTWAAYLAS